MTLTIRSERPADEAAVAEVTRAAFASHPHSSHTEHFIIQSLRQAHALSISLVAELEDRVVGHIAFSPVTISDGSAAWYGLGPVSVAPELQGKGIGRTLIQQGLGQLRERRAAGCVVLGEPSLYGRFGFTNDPGLFLPDVPQEFFLSLCFSSRSGRGEVTYHEAFSSDSSSQS